MHTKLNWPYLSFRRSAKHVTPDWDALAERIDNAEKWRVALTAACEDIDPDLCDDAHAWIDYLFVLEWNARVGAPAGRAAPGVPLLVVWERLGRCDLP